jgi:hypothetical protein
LLRAVAVACLDEAFLLVEQRPSGFSVDALGRR